MSHSYLVDVNLPKYFSFFNEGSYIFVSDINLTMPDSEIWNYALQNDLVILTKDADFYNRFLISENAPKVIYFQLGNFSLKQLFLYFEANWEKIKNAIPVSRFIIARENNIECIS
ncbi:MAG TPA: DUF5615 family PIN-like protein [Flavobacterium sp.]|nr:DUF5615 family PIN-like protein [Flavobacterium sp.]